MRNVLWPCAVAVSMGFFRQFVHYAWRNPLYSTIFKMMFLFHCNTSCSLCFDLGSSWTWCIGGAFCFLILHHITIVPPGVFPLWTACKLTDSTVQVWQAKYDLEDQMSLAKFLVDADIRLVRAECPPSLCTLIVGFPAIEKISRHQRPDGCKVQQKPRMCNLSLRRGVGKCKHIITEWFHAPGTCTSCSARRDGCPGGKKLRMTPARCMERRSLP